MALGAALVARDVYAGFDVSGALAQLDALGRAARAGGPAHESAEHQAARLARAPSSGRSGSGGTRRTTTTRATACSPTCSSGAWGSRLTLAIIYCNRAAGRRAGVRVGFPGHFLVRIEKRDGDALIVDPFYGGRVLDEASLVRMVSRALGPDAKLVPSHLAAASSRAVLVRVLTN